MRTNLSRKRTMPGSPLADTRGNIFSLADTHNGNGDEESLLRQRSSSFSDSAAPQKYTRVSRAKVFSHKICARIPAGSNNREGREGVIGLLQDIVMGIALGTLGMSILLLLDYYSIINLETARVFRKTAADVFTPEILESIQEDQREVENTKYISIDVYNAMKKELTDSQAVIDKEKKIVGIRATKESSLEKEFGSLRPEYDKLIKDTGLDIWCPDCHWGMGMNCQQRVNYMLENYSDTATTIECIAKLVVQGKEKNGKCIKSS